MKRRRMGTGKPVGAVKRFRAWVLVLGVLAVAAIPLLAGQDKQQKAVTKTTEEKNAPGEKPWSRDSLREGVATAIEYDKQYRAYVPSKEEAMQAIREYGIRQRERYVNPPVEEMEMQMEKDFAIMAVNLGEIEEETAGDIRDAFAYMYAAYPQLKGSITNVSLGNFEHRQAGNVAVTQNAEFMINEEFGRYPFVVKYEIIFNAAKFKNRQKLLEDCAYQVQTGYWPEGSDITSVVVHELGHQLLNVIAMEQFGLEDACYITEKNGEAYSRYVTDSLSVNQSVAKAVLGRAYDIWKQEYHHTGMEEEFRGSISGYAKGEQADGGISYGETVAEAVADVYLHGEKAADASRAIVDAVHLFTEGVEENARNLDEGTGEDYFSE
ncbi:MAG: hypothetical protein NC124_07935 [Clostridium sp.]|nr:hypothetical protein [Clostridium sp.]